jgi:hypothetical protein
MSWYRLQRSRPFFYLDLCNEIKDALVQTAAVTPMLLPGFWQRNKGCPGIDNSGHAHASTNEKKDVLAQTTVITPMLLPESWR